jgi:hypothetical protein
MVLMGYSGARGTLIYEKNLMSKISCQTPFKFFTWVFSGLPLSPCLVDQNTQNEEDESSSNHFHYLQVRMFHYRILKRIHFEIIHRKIPSLEKDFAQLKVHKHEII